jgi:hypothetical protein
VPPFCFLLVAVFWRREERGIERDKEKWQTFRRTASRGL